MKAVGATTFIMLACAALTGGCMSARVAENETSAAFAGVGVLIARGENVIRIVRVADGGPSDKAGLNAGDAIVKIADVETMHMSLEKVARMLRGAEGSDVSVVIRHAADNSTRTVTLTRRSIDLQNIKWKEGIVTIQMDGEPRIVNLRYAPASRVKSILDQAIELLSNQKRQKTLKSDVRIIADDPTNTLVIFAEKRDMHFLESIIAILDVEVESHNQDKEDAQQDE